MRFTRSFYRALPLIMWIIVTYSFYVNHLVNQEIKLRKSEEPEVTAVRHLADLASERTSLFTSLPLSTSEPSKELSRNDTEFMLILPDAIRWSIEQRRLEALANKRAAPSPAKLSSVYPVTMKPVRINQIPNKPVAVKPVSIKPVDVGRRARPVPAGPLSYQRSLIDEYRNMGGIAVDASKGPVNPHPFRYIINPFETCDVTTSPNIFLLVYIHTRPESIRQRELIRSTWGNVQNYGVKVRLVFVMGILEDEYVQEAIKLESKLYHDILQENFLDTYYNLTYKAVSALKWATEYCSQARFVLKADDDAFVNMHLLIQYLLEKYGSSGQVSRTLACNVWHNSTVARKGKWAVTFAQRKYPTWPDFCQGLAYIMTSDVVASLYRVSYDVPFLWMDDVYVTGFLAKKLGIVHTQFSHFFVLDYYLERYLNSRTMWKSTLFSHVRNFNLRKWAWNRILRLMNFASHSSTVRTTAARQPPTGNHSTLLVRRSPRVTKSVTYTESSV